MSVGVNLIHADDLKLGFGSFNGGIFQFPMANITTPASVSPTVTLSQIMSLKLAQPPPGTHLVGGNNQPTEAGFNFKPSGSKFFYQFFSRGITPLIGVRERLHWQCIS